MKRTPLPASAGFTLIELMIVVVIVGVMGAVAFMRNSSPAAYTVLSQGEALAAKLRHTQALATTWSRSLQVALDPGTGTYSVSCVTTGTSPCNSSPVFDPATNASFSVSVQKGVTVSGPATLKIDSFGKPAAAATYTLSSGSGQVTVTIAATTGFVSVSTH